MPVLDQGLRQALTAAVYVPSESVPVTSWVVPLKFKASVTPAPSSGTVWDKVAVVGLLALALSCPLSTMETAPTDILPVYAPVEVVTIWRPAPKLLLREAFRSMRPWKVPTTPEESAETVMGYTNLVSVTPEEFTGVTDTE